MNDIFEQEAAHLLNTQRAFEEIIADTRLMQESLPALYRADPDLLNDMLLQTHNRIALLKRSLEKPYFARIDFSSGEKEKEYRCCYIGKIGVSDADNRIVTVDWRAPIATLYYDSNVGPASYAAPGGTISGELLLKRQFEIENGELISFRDVDTVMDDALLKPYLGVSADHRLKNIVASIQSEQNRIIRAPLTQNLVVQGAAGSGKTTVALHRIAYLVYNNRDKINPRQYMVIGPNDFFISYISSVLPDLDVDSVPQYTFARLAQSFIGETFSLQTGDHPLAASMQGRAGSDMQQIKTSLSYKQALDRFWRQFCERVVPEQDFSLHGFVLISWQQVKKAWNAADPEGMLSLAARRDKCILLLSSYLKPLTVLLHEQLSQVFKERYRLADNQKDLARLHKERAYIEGEIEKGCRASLKSYLSAAAVGPVALYRRFVNELEQYLPADFQYTAALKKETLGLMRRKTLSLEDLAGVLYLSWRLRGSGKYERFCHVVVDEAQDLGAFEFFVLRCLMPQATFTIVGDLAQAIYGYRAIHDWKEVTDDVFEGNATVCEMVKSYRTTIEIMQAACFVTRALGLPDAVAVIRHGDPVQLHAAQDDADAIKQIAALTRQHLKCGYESVALIVKTEEEQASIYESLFKLGMEISPITEETQEFKAGLCIVTAARAKGLEFDSVILCDGSDEIYKDTSRLDYHLLYVAMTRPLHRLDVVYTKNLTAPLREWEKSQPLSNEKPLP